MRSSNGKLLLIASNYPPVRGGSSAVYRELAQKSDGCIHVMAPRRSYIDGELLSGFDQYDKSCSHEVYRVPLLRTPLYDGKADILKRIRLLMSEVWIRITLTARVAVILYKTGIRVICVGELISNGWMVPLYRKLFGVRTIIYVHGEEITTIDGYDDNAERRKKYLSSADVIIAVSQFTKESIVNMMAESESKIITVQNGVDYHRFNASMNVVSELRHKYCLQNKFVFISVCRLLEKKGIDHAIRAFSKIQERCNNSVFVIVGEGAYRSELVRIAKIEAISDRIIFTGEAPDDVLPAYYQLGDVFVMPNRKLLSGDTEGFGLVFLEANACGLPVIAGRDGGSVDAVTHEVNGLVVDGNSIDEIANAMVSLYLNADLRNKLAINGLLRAQNSDWEIKYREFYRACFVEKCDKNTGMN